MIIVTREETLFDFQLCCDPNIDAMPLDLFNVYSHDLRINRLNDNRDMRPRPLCLSIVY